MRRPTLFLALSIAVTVVLHVVPYGHYLGYPLVLLSTFAHELGHGIAGVLVGARFESFEMAWDGSGRAHVTGYDGRFQRAFISAGGLVGPACAAAITFAIARRPRFARLALAVFGACVVVCTAWVVRSLCGLLFAGALAATCLFIARKTKDDSIALFTLLFVAVQLSLSVFSRGDYLFRPVAHMSSGDVPSDVANMSTALLLPYWFWGALCGAFSVAVLLAGVRYFLRGQERPGRPLP